jgi:hypothetical protein
MRTAMQNLHERWGLGTSQIARALGISERVARLARDSSEPAEGAKRLDDFFTYLYDDIGIAEPAVWMSEPIIEGYTATRWHLYEKGLIDVLGANAERLITVEQMLAELDPDWRPNYWSSFNTFLAEDGHLSTRGKTYDEVRAQIPEEAR